MKAVWVWTLVVWWVWLFGVARALRCQGARLLLGMWVWRCQPLAVRWACSISGFVMFRGMAYKHNGKVLHLALTGTQWFVHKLTQCKRHNTPGLVWASK